MSNLFKVQWIFNSQTLTLISVFVCAAARYPVTSTLDYFLKLLDAVLIYNLSNHEFLYAKPSYTGSLSSFQRAVLWT